MTKRNESKQPDKDRIALLCARGLIRPPTESLSMRRLRALLARVPGSTRLSEAMREERDTGR